MQVVSVTRVGATAEEVWLVVVLEVILHVTHLVMDSVELVARHYRALLDAGQNRPQSGEQQITSVC